MTWDLSNIPSILRPDLEDRLARLAASADSAAADAPSRHRASLPFVWACSHFVAEACLRDRGLLAWLFAERRLDEPASEEALRQDLEANLDPAADDA